MTLFLYIPGQPVAKARPRFSRKTGGAYTPSKTRTAESLIRIAWVSEHGEEPLTGPLRLEALFVLKTPQRKPSLSGTPHTCRPDVDNLLKTVQDALNGAAYADDSQIAEIRARKVYGAEPGTLIRLTTLAADWSAFFDKLLLTEAGVTAAIA